MVRRKGYSFINISGLAIGIACCLLIMLWVFDELSFDNFHVNRKDLYKIVEYQHFDGGDIKTFGQTPLLLSKGMKDDFPQVEKSTRYWRRMLLLRSGQVSFMEKGAMVDPSFLSMFTFPLEAGDPKTVLAEKNSILITRQLATKFFGSQDPIGRRIEIAGRGELAVTGVLKDIPANSHLQFSFLASFNLRQGGYGSQFDKWGLNDFETYIQLKKGIKWREFSNEISWYIRRHRPKSHVQLFLIPITSIHLSPDIWSPKRGNKKYIFIFSGLALLILFIACINFINITTAHSSCRLKEIGMRKSLGAGKKNIIMQFLGETLFLSLFVWLAVVLLMELLLPLLNSLSGKDLEFGLFLTPLAWIGSLIITVATGLISVLYPSLFISSRKITNIIKGQDVTDPGKPLMRQGLVVVQFTIATALIAGTLIALSQVRYMQNMDMGFERDNVVCMDVTRGIARQWTTWKTELMKHPSIKNIAISNSPLGQLESTTSNLDWPGKDKDKRIQMGVVGVGFDFADTFGLKMKEGRFYSRTFPSDVRNGFVINEEAAKIIGSGSVLGKKMRVNSRSGTIIGVVRNFHFDSARQKLGPLILYPGYGIDVFFIKIDDSNIPATLSFIQKTFLKLAPQDPFTYTFLDDEINELYQSEDRMGKMLFYFTFLAIFISCLGLFGLASFSAQQRTKEIGVRKVLGATLPGIVFMQLKEFLKLVLLSNILAWPISYLVMNNWMHNFAYRTDMGITPFVQASVLALSIALFTVSYKSIKAASTNPVEALKYE